MANRATHLSALARTCPDKTAIIFGDARYSFAELEGRVMATAGGLAHLGIGKSSHVGILLPSCPDFVIVQQALFALGATITPLNILYRANEIAHAVASCDLHHLVSTAALAAPLESHVLPPVLRSIVTTDAPVPDQRGAYLPDAMAASRPITALADVAPGDVAMLLLTSATTGKAKGVMLTAANLAANYDRTPAWLGIDRTSVILCALPLYNTFGLNQCINAMLVTGATMILLPRFDPGDCIAAIAEHRCTFLPAVPTMLQKIIDHPDATTASLGSIAQIMTGGAPVPAALLRRVLERAPRADLLTGYGLTEGTALVTLTPVRLGPDGETDRTIGQVLDGMTLAIMDDDGELVPPGTVGEIVIRGPNVMAGYYRAPEDSAAALAGGWLHSGDVGYVSDAGRAYIVDRKKDVIIRGGQNIYPADIEEVLYGIAGIAEVAVIAMEDDLLGEVPVAYVALQAGADVPVSAMLQRCTAELAAYKLPAAIHIRDELPKGPTGKILRRALKPTTETVQ